MFLNAPVSIFKRAEELRKNMTPTEIILWYYLKEKPHGHKFRRQHPISTYIADFYCHSLKLIIEVDGGIHLIEANSLYDIDRQKNLENSGISFLRFTNNEVEKYFEIVKKKIDSYIINHKDNAH